MNVNQQYVCVPLDFSLELGQRLEGQLELCENRYSDIRCLAPSYNDNLLTAIALSNGKVAVCPFMPYNENSPEFGTWPSA